MISEETLSKYDALKRSFDMTIKSLRALEEEDAALRIAHEEKLVTMTKAHAAASAAIKMANDEEMRAAAEKLKGTEAKLEQETKDRQNVSALLKQVQAFRVVLYLFLVAR